MADNLHDVVKLLLARMESHPEEFIPAQAEQDYIIRDTDANRWWRAMSEVQEFGTEEERKAIAAKLRVLRLQQAHEWAMDELCNGEDRRRKERERHELETQRYAMAQQAYANVQPGQYMAVSSPNTLGIGAANPSQGLHISHGNLQLGNETLDEGILKKIKGALGI
jgi:hypothetical protein